MDGGFLENAIAGLLALVLLGMIAFALVWYVGGCC
jgi:hypothetical protein